MRGPLKKLLEFLDIAFGSLIAVLPPLEAIKELKGNRREISVICLRSLSPFPGRFRR